MLQLPEKIVRQCLIKVNIYLHYDPTLLFLGLYWREMKMQVQLTLEQHSLNYMRPLIHNLFSVNTVIPFVSWVLHLQIQLTANWKQNFCILNHSVPTVDWRYCFQSWLVETADAKGQHHNAFGESKVIDRFSTGWSRHF